MACSSCMVALYPSEVKRNEGHLSPAFGDQGKRVVLDGVEVSNECYEAQVGEEGWVMLYKRTGGHFYQCACGGGVAAERKFGKVELLAC